MELLEKTIDRLKAFEPQEGYYGAFSGGKDSQVLYHVAQMAGVKVDWHFHVTTVDPPQLLSFIRKYYPDVVWVRPSLTMFQLILKKKMLPTRPVRFCCAELKEGGGRGRSILMGVRAEESFKRSTYQMVGTCKEKHKYLIRPLLDWKWGDVWKFLQDQKINHCELYDPPYNFKRIGCIGCPMAGRLVWREFRFFPNFKKAYLNTIQKLMDMGRFSDFNSPESVMKWWVSGNNKEKFFAEEAQQFFCFDN
jgi:phosphoadenosine phosphosulfate reductase